MGKDTSVIPEGCYCYSYVKGESVVQIINGQECNFPKTKNCPYFTWINDTEYPCEKLQYCNYCEDDIDDACKICGINENWEDDWISDGK
jgi:hypothetical protein